VTIEAPDEVIGEKRWPMAVTVLVAIVLTVSLPAHTHHDEAYVLAGFEALLLVLMMVADPGRIDRRTAVMRKLSIAMVAVLVVTAFAATIDLVGKLVHGTGFANDAGVLLQVGASVWVLNVIAFAFAYWEFDRGGAAARAHELVVEPDFAFPQHLDPEVSTPGWRPVFVDYLYLAFTSATAFSPTDAMPLTGRAKLAMMVQGTISLVILGLVIARAVNVFS
jgi:hypothetical protein